MSKDTRLAEIVMNDSPFAWWEFDVINNTVSMNDLKVTMLGYDPAKFKGKGYQALMNLVHPEDYGQCMNAMRKVLSGEKEIYQTDYRIKDNIGNYHWYMDRGAVIERLDGKIWRLRGIVIDLGKEHRQGANAEAIVELLNRHSADQNNLIVVCSSCQRIRIKKEEWTPVTQSLGSVIKDAISHGICPDCVRSLYPEMAEKILAKFC